MTADKWGSHVPCVPANVHQTDDIQTAVVVTEETTGPAAAAEDKAHTSAIDIPAADTKAPAEAKASGSKAESKGATSLPEPMCKQGDEAEAKVGAVRETKGEAAVSDQPAESKTSSSSDTPSENKAAALDQAAENKTSAALDTPSESKASAASDQTAEPESKPSASYTPSESKPAPDSS